MENIVSFYRGKKKNYKSIKNPNAIYYATDTREIIVDNIIYGVSTDWEAKILGSVIKIEKNSDALAEFIVSTRDGTSYNISFSKEILGAISTAISDAKSDLENKINSSQSTVEEELKKSDLSYDPATKQLSVSFWNGEKSTGIDVSPFLKDGMLEDIQYITKPEVYSILDNEGKEQYDEDGKLITATWEKVPFLKFIFNEDWAKDTKNYAKIVRIPVNELIDIYEGEGAIDISQDNKGINKVTLTQEFISTLGVKELTGGSWKLNYEEATQQPIYIADSTSIVDALLKLDDQIRKINLTDKGTVSVTDTWMREGDSEETRNKYVTVDSEVDETGAKYIVKEDLDNTLMGWEEIE